MSFIPHFYFPHEDLLQVGKSFFLSKKNSHHIIHVLRMKNNQILKLFDGININFFLAKIKKEFKNMIEVEVISQERKNFESSLFLHLGQVIPSKKKMNFIIQKSTELGVNIVTPLFLKLNIKPHHIHIEKKIKKWQKISISACEQSKRNLIPNIHNLMTLENWCQEDDNSTKILFDPSAKNSINIFNNSLFLKKIRVLIGSEIGFSKQEIKMIKSYGFKHIRLGPRILRTETAVLTAISILQEKFGDLK